MCLRTGIADDLPPVPVQCVRQSCKQMCNVKHNNLAQVLYSQASISVPGPQRPLPSPQLLSMQAMPIIGRYLPVQLFIWTVRYWMERQDMHMSAADKENHTSPTVNILCKAGVVVERSRGEDQATAGSLQSICWGSQVCTTSALRTLQPHFCKKTH